MYEQQYAGNQYAAQALNPSLGSIQLSQPSPAATLRQQAAAFRQSAEATRRGSVVAAEQADFMDKRAVEFDLSADALDPVKPGRAFASAFPADTDGGYVANSIREMEDRPDRGDEATPNARRPVSGVRSYKESFVREASAIPPSSRFSDVRPFDTSLQDQQWMRQHALDAAMRSFGAALPISAGEVLKVADQFRRFLAGEPEPDKAPPVDGDDRAQRRMSA